MELALESVIGTMYFQRSVTLDSVLQVPLKHQLTTKLISMVMNAALGGKSTKTSVTSTVRTAAIARGQQMTQTDTNQTKLPVAAYLSKGLPKVTHMARINARATQLVNVMDVMTVDGVGLPIALINGPLLKPCAAASQMMFCSTLAKIVKAITMVSVVLTALNAIGRGPRTIH